MKTNALHEENLAELALCVDHGRAVAWNEAVMAFDAKDQGRSNNIREQVLTAARALTKREQTFPKLWEDHDWMLCCEKLAHAIFSKTAPALSQQAAEDFLDEVLKASRL